MGSGLLIRNQAKLPASSILFVKGRSTHQTCGGEEEIKGKGGRGGEGGARGAAGHARVERKDFDGTHTPKPS